MVATWYLRLFESHPRALRGSSGEKACIHSSTERYTMHSDVSYTPDTSILVRDHPRDHRAQQLTPRSASLYVCTSARDSAVSDSEY